MQNNHYQRLLVATLISLSLVACAKSPNHADEAADISTSSSAKMQSMAAQDESSESSDAANLKDRPDVLMSEQINPVEQARKMVKTASIDFEVKDVYQTGLALEQLTVQFAGFVEQKDIHKEVTDQFSRSNKKQ